MSVVAIADRRPRYDDLSLTTLSQLLRAGDSLAGFAMLRRLDALEAWALAQIATLKALASNTNDVK